MQPADPLKRRRTSVLASLLFAPGGTASVQHLRDDLARTHNIAASADAVRGDLTWLQEQGLVRLVQDAAQTTERGGDVAFGRAPWPGE
jgi:hypothetical protein